jgi:hypothetical protein
MQIYFKRKITILYFFCQQVTMFGIRGLLICPFLLLLTFQITSCEQQNETAVGENTGRDGKGKQMLH